MFCPPRHSLSRRDWIGLGFAAAAVAATFQPTVATAQTAPAPAASSATVKAAPPHRTTPANKTCSIELSDLKGITSEVDVNVTSVIKSREGLLSQTTCEKIDRSTYTRVKKVDAPWFVPEALRPREIRTIPNSQLLLAGVVAGSATEIARISVLYPLDTVKNRIQADPHHRRARTLRRKVQALGLSFLEKWREGGLYAGVVPAVLASVPASGVYCGIRDVTKRVLAGDAGAFRLAGLPGGPVVVSLLGAAVADVASLAVRTPADVLALRLQVGRAAGDDQSDLWEALGDGWACLPTIIATDLPYLLSRVALNYAVVAGGEGLGRYQAETIAVACGCAFLTTPFDVARTRILVDDAPRPPTGRDADKEEEEEEGLEEQDRQQQQQQQQQQHIERQRRSRRRDGVLRTMAEVAREGDGGARNLFAGSIERTAYYGIGRAWLDPIRLIGYVGIRDAVLLRWFD